MTRASFAAVRGCLLASIGTAAVAVANPALAQDGAAAPEAAPQAEATGTDDSVTATNDIVVTARRRNEVLQDVPIAVTAYTGEQFERQGALDITASNAGMKVTGRALLAAIPAKLDASMDFRAGPPTQVMQTVTVSGQPDARSR